MPKIQTKSNTRQVMGGVDTHADTHTVAAIDLLGRRLGHAVFEANDTGYAALHGWLADHGTISAVGVEGTGSYGAGLTRYLTGQHINVVEVNRPDRAARRLRGKSDPVDAENAAAAVLAQTATATPKARTGTVEAIRIIHSTRAGAVKACTAAKSTFTNLVRTSPNTLHDQLHPLTRTQQLRIARSYRTTTVTDPHHAAKLCLHRLAERIHQLTLEITAAERDLTALTAQTAPTLRARPGTGPITVAQLLITAGDNLDRIHSEAAFAALCGTSPVLASSGRSHHHRLNRGGDRQANCALHTIATNRLRYHQPTRDYAAARTTGKATPRILRQLKRAIAREVYHLLLIDLTPAPSTADTHAGAESAVKMQPPTGGTILTAPSTGAHSKAEENTP